MNKAERNLLAFLEKCVAAQRETAMDALKEAKDICRRDAEGQYAATLPAEDMTAAFVKVNALAAIAQAEQLKRIADVLEAIAQMYSGV